MKNINYKNIQRRFALTPRKVSGFTIMEIIVALGLFTVVIMISMGALVSMSGLNSKVRTMRTAMDNLNLALESMSREVRMGSVYVCSPSLPAILNYGNYGADCDISSGGGQSIAFLSQDGYVMVYRLNNNVVQRSKDGGNSFSDITAPGIKITKLKFYVIGAGVGTAQPHVIISLTGTVGVKSPSSFTMQTALTQRLPK